MGKKKNNSSNVGTQKPQQTVIPPSPAPTSATLKDSPLMPITTLKSTISCITPIKESEPEGLFSKQKSNIMMETSDLDSVLSPDMRAVADLLSTMKRTLRAMESTVTMLGKQTEKVATLAPAIKANSELTRLREILEKQAQDQAAEVKELRLRLEDEVKEAIKGKLREQTLEMLRKAVAEKVQERVRDQLNEKIPQELRHQIKVHRRQVLEIKTNIHNMNARSFNSSLRSTTDTLRPLLRPLPSAQQSPFSGTSEPSDATPTDITSSPTPSEIFPRTLGDLCNLSADHAKQLVTDFDLGSSVIMNPSSKGSQPLTTPSSLVEGRADREENINKLMAYIGVPFQMLPNPISASQSPAGRRILSPLIMAASVV